MDNTGKKQKNNNSPSSRGVGLAVVAAFILAVLLAVSVYFIVGSNSKEESAAIDSQTGNDWSILSQTAKAELFLIEEHKRELREKELAKLQEDLAKEALAKQDEDDASDDDNQLDDDSIGVAYLTFDDGPSRAVTEGILDVLAEENIKATFFVLPREGVEDIFLRIINEGHELANHSYSHNFNRLYSRGVDAFVEDVLRAHDFILDNFGYEMSLFRFPGGSMSWRRETIAARREALDNIGYIDFDWHIDSGDAAPSGVDTSAGTLTRNILNHTGGREHVIVLMHDYRWRQSTLEALPAVIDGLREQGYRFDIMGNFPIDT